MNLRTKLATFTLLAIALPLIASAGPKANIDIRIDNMDAVGSDVTLGVTNLSAIAVTIEINVRAFACAGTTLSQFDCEKVATMEFSQRLDAETSNLFTVNLPVAAGNYIFRAQVTGSKGSAEDQKFGFIGHTVP